MMISISPEFPAVYLLVFPGVQSASALLRAGWGCNTKHKATPRSTAARRGDQPSPSPRQATSPRLARHRHRLSSSAHCEDVGPGTVSVLMVS